MHPIHTESVTWIAGVTDLELSFFFLLTFLLFGLKATDMQTIGGAGLILCLAALMASYLPMRRAWRLDPTAALRLE